jgi:UrcA family protein
MHRFTFVALAVSAMLSVAASAAPATVRVQAAPPGGVGVRAVTLQYDDQDVSSSAGAATMLERINNAAEAVCGRVRPGNGEQIAVCRKSAVREAVATIGVPALSQVAAAK